MGCGKTMRECGRAVIVFRAWVGCGKTMRECGSLYKKLTMPECGSLD